MAAQLARDGDWQGADIVVEGRDAAGAPMRLTRSACAVPASLVRRWLIVKGADGQLLLRVVRDFLSSDGVLFTVRGRDQ